MALRAQVVTTGVTGSPYYNTYYTRLDTEADADILRDELLAYYLVIDQFLTNSAVVSFNGQVEVFDEASGQTTGTYPTTSWGVNGTWGTGQAPGGTCVVARLQTGNYFNGRETRGRQFISGLGDIGAGSFGVPTSVVTAWEPALAALQADASLGVYSPTRGLVLDAQATSIWSQFGLMRSRRD